MTVARYALGFGALAVIVGTLATASVIIRRRMIGEPARVVGLLAGFVIGLTLLIGLSQLLGSVGLFRLGPILAGCIVICASALAYAWTREEPQWPFAERPPRPYLRPPLNPSPWTLLALAGALAVVAEWLVPTLVSYDVGVTSVDSVWYHLPWAASFAQTGNIASLRFTDVEYLTAFYPATGELLHGVGIVLFGRDLLSPVLNVGFLGLTLLAAWCVGRSRGAAPAALLGATVALSLPMLRSSQGGTAANDVVGIFFLLASAALWMDNSHSPGGIALAGLSAGLAISVKLSLLGPVLALTVVVIGHLWKAPRREKALWIAALAVGGGYWYVRNLVLIGNPLPWVHLGFLPVPAEPLQQGTGYSVSHYLLGWKGWSQWFEPGLSNGLGLLWPGIAAAAFIGPLACLWRDDEMAQLFGGVALASVLVYVLTPETAAGPPGQPIGFGFNLRYGAPALTLAMTALPLAFGTRRSPIIMLVLATTLGLTLSEERLWPPGYGPAAGAVVVGTAAALALLIAVWRSTSDRVRRPTIALATLIGALVLAAGAGGYPGARHYLKGRYLRRPSASPLTAAWAFFQGIRDARVGAAGTYIGFFAYPLYGPDSSNRVQYIAARGRHGSFTPITTCLEWRAALNAGHYRYVVASPGRSPWQPSLLTPSPEGSWTISDPAAQPLLVAGPPGQEVEVFRMRGVSTNAGCP